MGKPISETGRLGLPVGAVTVTAVADALVGDAEVLIGLLLIGPLLAAALLRPAVAAVVGLYATVAAVILGLPNQYLGEPGHILRVMTVLAAGVLAVGAAIWRQRADRERERLLERLRVANEARDYVLASTSHDLRSPLTVVAGTASLLQRELHRLSPRDRDLRLAAIVRHSDRMLRLVEDLLLSSRLEAGAFAVTVGPVEVAGVVRAGVEALGGGAGIEMRCRPGLRVMADPERLEQIVANLVANALKYGARPIEISAAAAGGSGEVEIRVGDRGPGVPAEFVEHLFERYRRAAPNRGGGSGLGLAIVRDLARAQGGDAWYEPQEDRGAVFVVRLPAPPGLS